jgi:hypothetical protein
LQWIFYGGYWLIIIAIILTLWYKGTLFDADAKHQAELEEEAAANGDASDEENPKVDECAVAALKEVSGMQQRLGTGCTWRHCMQAYGIEVPRRVYVLVPAGSYAEGWNCL